MEEQIKYRQIYIDLWHNGRDRAPRGLPTKELENYHINFFQEHQFINYACRNLNLDYIKTELKWYLNGDCKDLSICDHAKIWQNCVTNGVLFSNYGHYIFKLQGLLKCAEILTKDPDSRQARISIFNSHDHLFEGNKDVPCTVGLGFRIRDSKLNMTVHMRSQDAVFGLGNDLPFFNFVWEVLAVYLGVPQGTYHHFVESFHVYERHYEMVKNIVHGDSFELITRPRVVLTEASALILGKKPETHTAFTEWLWG